MAQQQDIREIVLANRLTDGIVVYLDTSGGWAEHLRDAAVTHDAPSRAKLESNAEAGLNAQQIAGWEFVEVVLENGSPRIVKNKQFIQSLGPTVRRDLGKQADLAA